ncbi:MAG: acetolactate synthase small subunit [Acidobacteria bacterium]|nr:acetolactate synthase small subunit [Acidobacteriota bacterium]
MLHTLVAYVEDKPGVLNRIASLFRRRAFNIESLTVGHTEQLGVSRMTIVIDGSQTSVERVEQNLYKLVNVLRVDDVSSLPAVVRDLALIKVKTSPQTRSEILQLAHIFRARIVDVSKTTVILEVTGDENKIEATIEMLRPFGIVEMVRTGVVAMVRGPGRFDPAEVAAWASATRKPGERDANSNISSSV